MSFVRHAVLLALVGGALAPHPAIAKSTTKQSFRLDVTKLELTRATGLQGSGDHRYTFKGEARVVRRLTNKRDPLVGKTKTSIDEDVSERTPATLHCLWEPDEREFHEVLKLEGEKAGEIESTFRCDRDPVVFAAKCSLDRSSDESSWQSYGFRLESPLASRLGDLKEATDLSAAAAQAARPSGRRFEGEDLVGAARASQGKAAVQDMARFGASWSGGAQLFWPAERQGAEVRVVLAGLGKGRYDVKGYFTQAQDYGRFEISLDGIRMRGPLDGYNTAVRRSKPVLLGVVALEGPDPQLVVRVVGKNSKSSGYFFGLDRLDFQPE